MWRPVSRSYWPEWAVNLNSLWQHKTGAWLSSQTNHHSTLWEIRAQDGRVLMNQMDLPFREGLEGAPVAWANNELLRYKGEVHAEG
jgi:hypothetical protein